MELISVKGIGRLTKDLAAKEDESKGGSFPIAIDHGFGEQKSTEFWLCYVNKATFDNMVKAKVKKGSLIMFEGTPHYKSTKNKEGGYDNNAYIIVSDWRYAPSNEKKEAGDKPKENSSFEPSKAPDFKEFVGEETEEEIY